jgi:hypothetical protein
MLNKKIIIISISVIFIATLALAYGDEIKQASEEIFKNYFQEKIKSQSPEYQKSFEDFQQLPILDKFITASKNQNINQNNNKIKDNLEDKNE